MISEGMPVPPLCFICKPDSGAVIRPDVVMFGEMIKNEHYLRILDFIKGIDILIISGTTLQFHYLSIFIASVAEQGGRIVYIDPHASPYKNVFLVADSALEVPEKVEAIRLTADEGLANMVKSITSLKEMSGRN
jgi:NAD-dependent deacetylase